MVSSAQRDEFQRRGVLRLPATIPAAATATMRRHVWRHLAEVYGIHPDRPDTWTVHTPSHFQKLTGTGAFDAMATDEVVAAVDDLLGVGRWYRPPHWGRPLVTFPRRDTDWTVPTRGWHLDSHGDLDDLTMLVVFAHLARVRSRGGGTLVVTGSHHLTTPRGPGRGTAPVRSAEVKAHLGTAHPWLRELWTAVTVPTGSTATWSRARCSTVSRYASRNSPVNPATWSSCIRGCCMPWRPTAVPRRA